MARTLAELIQDSANRIPEVTVTIDFIGNICISDDTREHEDIFIDSTDAENFIAERDRLYESVQTLDKGVIELHLAEQLVENFWN